MHPIHFFILKLKLNHLLFQQNKYLLTKSNKRANINLVKDATIVVITITRQNNIRLHFITVTN